MKTPYLNFEQRNLVKFETTSGKFFLVQIAWLKLCREIKRSFKL